MSRLKLLLPRRLRAGITLKLFAITSAVFIAFATAVMVLQSVFFERYYEYRTVRDAKRDLTALAERYHAEAGLYGPGALPGLRPDSGTGQGEYPDADKGAPRYPPYFAAFEKTYYGLTSIVTRVDGMYRITTSGGTGRRDSFRDTGSAGLPFGELPTVLPLPLPQEQTMLLGEAFRYWLTREDLVRRVTVEGRTVVYRLEDLAGNGKVAAADGIPGGGTLVAVAPASTPGDTDWRIVFAVLSLQPVGQANAILRDFYVAFYGLGIVLIVLLSLWYSRRITRPLRRLGRTAERLAKLDFAARTDIGGEDEIGRLGRTMNFLSANLKDTLGQLQEANSRLQAEIEQEKRLERMRREFVSGVSHELKTPLSVIGGYAEGLRDGIGGEAARRRYVDVILEETERMSALVGDMLDLSRLEAGQYELQLSVFDVRALAEATVEKLRRKMDAKGIAVTVAAEGNGTPGGWQVRADRSRIAQVAANLLDNAIRHCPDGGRIAVRLSREQAAAVGLEIWNEGAPIPEEELPRIWEHFYRGDQSRSREGTDAASGGGSGIGLAVVRQLLELHGSDYGVCNTEGGVAFSFRLPAAGEEHGEQRNTAASE